MNRAVMLSGCKRALHRRPRTRLPAPRITAAIIASGSLAVLICGCGGSHPSAGSGRAAGTSTNAEAVAFTSCMRSHGVSRYPDPTSRNSGPGSDGLPKVNLQALGASSSELQAAQKACQHLLPNGARSAPAVSRHMFSEMVNFARCMRSHDVSNWPDPVASTPAMLSLGAPAYMFHLDGLQGLDGRSFAPRIKTAMHHCSHLSGSQAPYSG